MNQYIPDAACRAAARAAAGQSLSEQEITAAFQRVADYKAKLQAEGKLTGMAERLRRFAEGEAERTKIAAAMQRRHAALNVLVRDRQEAAINTMISQGLHPKKALMAVLEGTQRGVTGGRRSVAANKIAYQSDFIGRMIARLEADVPHAFTLMRDRRFDSDVMREMMELKPDGKAGVTGNKDALKVARIFSEQAEYVRVEMNKLGASIGKLEGWAGPQTHDDLKMLGAGKDQWIGFISTKLDFERTFSEGYDPGQVAEMLGDIYDTITTGFSTRQTPASKGTRVNPSNLAKTLGASRVLHFKNAESALAYNAEFGVGNTISGMIGHLNRSADVAAAMEALGPNPEIMFAGLADAIKRRIRADKSLSEKERAAQIKSIDTQAGGLRSALDISLGLHSRPVNVTFAKIGQDIRSSASMASLGGVTITSIPSDTMSVAMASMFRGNNVLQGLASQIGGVLQGRPKAEAAEISFLWGEGYDGMLGNITNPAAANDGPIGYLAKMQQNFFKWTGLLYWTDVSRSVAGRTIAAEMGMRAKTSYGALPERYRDLLGRHGIDEPRWNAIRSAKLRNANGKDYVTPDLIYNVDEAAIIPLVSKRLENAKTPEARASIVQDGRRDLMMAALRFVGDETNYAIIETDAKTRRYATLGHTLRPGTLAGEIVRSVMQFKSFPLAFLDRTLGRAIIGRGAGAWDIKNPKFWTDTAPHIGALIAGMTLAGYASIIVKDALKGYWPPRDPADNRTWMAAFLQGGAAGIYGDFLFSESNRFGGGLLGTLAGPTIGNADKLAQTWMDARDAVLSQGDDEFSGARAFSTAVGMVPYGNLFYVKPALDFLVLNSMRDALSPGYLHRQERNRMREYGQESFVPRTLGR